jgi:hypothetical protein
VTAGGEDAASPQRVISPGADAVVEPIPGDDIEVVERRAFERQEAVARQALRDAAAHRRLLGDIADPSYGDHVSDDVAEVGGGPLRPFELDHQRKVLEETGRLRVDLERAWPHDGASAGQAARQGQPEPTFAKEPRLGHVGEDAGPDKEDRKRNVPTGLLPARLAALPVPDPPYPAKVAVGRTDARSDSQGGRRQPVAVQLEVLDGPPAERSARIGLPPSGGTLGSDPTRADVVLQARTVSGLHSRILPSAAGWVIRDCRSRNGTFVDDEHVGNSDARLRDGSVIGLGRSYRLKFRIGDTTGAVGFSSSSRDQS